MPGERPRDVLDLSEWLYRRLLWLYPSAYRTLYGPWMAQLFCDQLREANNQNSLRGIAGVWARTL